MRRFTLIASLALIGLSACSSESSSATTPADSDAPATVATTDGAVVDDTMPGETTVEETLPDDIEDSSGGEGASSEFCEIDQEIDDNSIALDGSATPADVEAYFTEFFPAALARLEANVPAEIAADVETLIEGSLAYGAVLEANDWRLEAAFADPALEELFINPEYEAAENRVSAYCET